MAEAAVERVAARYFCHQCTQEISPILPDYLCPCCQSGFIEELVQGPADNTVSEESDEEGDPFAQVAELWNMMNFLRREPEQQISTGATDSQNQSDPAIGSFSTRMFPSRRHHRFATRAPSRRHGDIDLRDQRMFLQQLVASLTENAGAVANIPFVVNLHSNPGDYAWGRGGWNAIITQLMNQLDGTGPPPLPKEKIEEIPFVNICQEQVDKVLQCTVCMEDFKLGEPVRRLSCLHHFHNDCITPWLELHGTCPICRKLLNEESSQENPFGTTLINSSGSASQPSTSNSRNPLRRSPSTSNSIRGNNYSPHLPSVYDFTEDFD